MLLVFIILVTLIVLNLEITVPLFFNHTQIGVDWKTHILRLYLPCFMLPFILSFYRSNTLSQLKNLLIRSMNDHDIILVWFQPFVRLIRRLILRIIIFNTHLESCWNLGNIIDFIIFWTARFNDSFKRRALLKLLAFINTSIGWITWFLRKYFHFTALLIFLKVTIIFHKVFANWDTLLLLMTLIWLFFLIDINLVSIRMHLVNCY